MGKPTGKLTNKLKKQWASVLFGILFSLGLGLNARPLKAQQVSADGTLNTLVSTPNNVNFTITNGTRSGQNLFHSFREFSIPKEGSAIFDLRLSPATVNVFSRVTGNNVSNINGLIKTIGGNRPNIFLLNPNGILLGPQARLDIGGSFLGTTAQGIQFDNSVLFSNAATEQTVLNIRVPTGVQMGANPAAIWVEGSGHGVTSQGTQSPYQRNLRENGLQVKPDQTLALLGGGITLNGGVLTAGNVELGSPVAGRSGENAFVGLQSIGNGFTFDYDQVGSYGNIQLLNQSLVDISSQNAGTMKINTQDLQIKDGSLLLSSTAGAAKGQIKIAAQGTFLMEGRTPNRSIGSGIEVYAIDSGEGAMIDILARDLIIRDISRVSSQASGKAATGDIRVQALQSVRLNSQVVGDSANAAIFALTNGQGNAGDIQIKTPFLRVDDDAVISAATFGAGNAGNIRLETDRIELSNGGTIGSSSFVQGNAGTLNIQTRSLSLMNGGLISSNSLGRGNAGSIEINASENVTLFAIGTLNRTSSQIRSTVRNASPTVQRIFKSPPAATGNGGSIIIRSPQISLDRDAEINVRNEGSGEGGDITLQGQNLQLNNRSSLNAATRVASGGNIRITSENVSLRNGSSINVTAGSRGEGGIIQIDTEVLLGLENSDIIANAFRGNGGQIRIKADQIYGLEYRSQLTSNSDITAMSQYGMNGSVSISDLRLDPNPEALPLPITLSDEKRRISDRCENSNTNRFIITGRGGLPKAPLWNLDSNRAWRDIRQSAATNKSTIASTQAQTSSTIAPASFTPPKPLIEASTWQTNPDGSISLVAPGSTKADTTIAFANCASAEVPGQ